MFERLKSFGKRKIPVSVALSGIGMFLMAGVLAAWTGSATVDFMTRTLFAKYIKAVPNQTLTVQERMDFTYNLHPVNYIKNSSLDHWSGGSNFVNTSLAPSTGGATKFAMPDGWAINGDKSGATLYRLPNVAPVSGTTILPGQSNSLYVENRNTSAGIGVSVFACYPAENGVSSSQSWYGQFLGQRTVFGAWFKVDKAARAAASVTEYFVRPFINTYSGPQVRATSYAVGPYASSGSWENLSAVTTVPYRATAVEVGFEMHPTILAGTALTGDSAYICAPYLLINPVNSDYIPQPNEIFYFRNPVPFDTNGSTFDTAGGTSSFAISKSTAGKISPNVQALYVTIIGNAADGTQHQFRPDTRDLTGATIYAKANAPSGTTGAVNATQWVKTDYNGDFDLYTSSGVTDISIYILGAQMR